MAMEVDPRELLLNAENNLRESKRLSQQAEQRKREAFDFIGRVKEAANRKAVVLKSLEDLKRISEGALDLDDHFKKAVNKFLNEFSCFLQDSNKPSLLETKTVILDTCEKISNIMGVLKEMGVEGKLANQAEFIDVVSSFTGELRSIEHHAKEKMQASSVVASPDFNASSQSDRAINRAIKKLKELLRYIYDSWKLIKNIFEVLDVEKSLASIDLPAFNVVTQISVEEINADLIDRIGEGLTAMEQASELHGKIVSLANVAGGRSSDEGSSG